MSAGDVRDILYQLRYHGVGWAADVRTGEINMGKIGERRGAAIFECALVRGIAAAVAGVDGRKRALWTIYMSRRREWAGRSVWYVQIVDHMEGCERG